MKALDRKLLRDARQMGAQALAISLVMACGVATFVMSLSTYASMLQTRDRYYDQYRFAEIFAPLKRAPNPFALRMAEIPGVAQVETRVVAGVTLDLSGMMEPVSGRIISIPEAEQDQKLNRLHIRSGRYIAPRAKGEVLVDEAFAEAHRLRPGSRLKAVINGRLEELTIVGIALSPEYIYTIQPGQIFPDNKRFGVFWMGYEELAAAFGVRGAFNDATLSLRRGTSKGDVLRRLDELTEPYGGIGAYTREDQVSHEFVSSELTQLRGMAAIIPVIFFVVSAFLLHVVLNRLISTQREQIAALKAFGYTRREVGWHYLKLALIIVAVAVVIGVASGAWLGRGLTVMYTQFFRFPDFAYRLGLDVLFLAAGFSVAAGFLAVLGAVQRAMGLPPAEAMRPEAPADYRATMMERLGLQRFLPQSARMIVRHVERRPVRSLLSVLGVALSIAVMILGSFSKDIIDHIADVQFDRAQRYDFHLGFVEPASARALHEVEQLPGVLRAEPFRSLPVRLHAAHRSRRVGLLGLADDRQLFELIDLHLHTARLPRGGIVLSRGLAEALHLSAGDLVGVETMEARRRRIEVPVADLVDEFSGSSAYMDLRALNELLQEGETISGAFVSIDTAREREFYAALKNTPRVASVSSKRAALAGFRETIAENFLRMRIFNVIFGCTIAAGVVYNSARIALSERSRELATLRVIGFRRGEISAILLGEIGLLVLVALPFGLLIGYGFAVFTTAALQTETQRFPAIVQPATLAFAVTVVLLAAVASSALVRRKLDKLDLVAVLKSQD